MLIFGEIDACQKTTGNQLYESMEEMRGSMKKMLESCEARPIKISGYIT